MFEVRGRYASAKIFTEVVEEEAIAQVIALLNQPYAEGQRVRMMPDIHAGAGCTIGTTMTISNKVCPNLVGVDIGCGMKTVKLAEGTVLDLERLDAALHGYDVEVIVPSGFDIRATRHSFCDRISLEALRCAKNVDLDRAYRSIGTLGGGNHFIEIDRDEAGNVYLVIHTGSRHLGIDVCKFYQEQAFKSLASPSQEERMALINSLKAAGRQRDIPSALQELAKRSPKSTKDLAWCEGQLFEDYIHDMRIAQRYAELNREAIAEAICQYMGWEVEDEFQTIHNYIDTEHMVLRKGAVSAQSGEKLLIPINMRDGSLLCIGKGNEDWNCSAPHGAGRLMSRAKAKATVSMAEFEESMAGIYTTSVSVGTLDESPMAYKRIEDIVGNIADTVDIVSVIKPIYNFKASS